MNATHKMIVSSVATVLSLGIISGTVWAQDAQGDLKLKNKSKIETLQKSDSGSGVEMKQEGQAEGGMKTEGDTRMKGEAGSQMKAEGKRMKGESRDAEMNAGAQSDRKDRMKATEPGSRDKGYRAEMKHKGSRTEMKSDAGSDKATSSGEQTGEQATGKNGESMRTGKANRIGTSNEKTGSIQKNGGVNVNVTTEQRTEIRQVVKTENVQPVEHVTFDVDVGAAIPHSVELHSLPPRIVEIVPAYQDYDYFILADGHIVIVDPDTYEIVYILA